MYTDKWHILRAVLFPTQVKLVEGISFETKTVTMIIKINIVYMNEQHSPVKLLHPQHWKLIIIRQKVWLGVTIHVVNI